MTRLLNKPLRTFIAFTCVILALSIPVYFYVVESIWIGELDDHNTQIKEQVEKGFAKLHPEDLNEKIMFWNQVQLNSQILPASAFRKDSVYLTEREMPGNGEMEMERFRGLSSVISLNNKPYTITIETNVEEVQETVLLISIITCVFLVFLTLGFIFLNRRLSKKIWAPFSTTLEKLKNFDLNKINMISFENTDIDEFMELNEALMKLIYNNINTYKQHKEFIQNASHELQTPLALLKTKIDMLIQDPALTQEQRKIIESLDNAMSRVGRINKNLLLLARIENSHYEMEVVELSELTKTLLDNFTDFAENKACAFVSKITSDISIKANESLIEIMITNLLSNTIRHGLANTEIIIHLDKQGLVISNAGENPLQEKNLFKRFSSAHIDNPGTGLGLAIVKEIADRYHWRVSYHFDDKRHVFSVLF